MHPKRILVISSLTFYRSPFSHPFDVRVLARRTAQYGSAWSCRTDRLTMLGRNLPWRPDLVWASPRTIARLSHYTEPVWRPVTEIVGVWHVFKEVGLRAMCHSFSVRMTGETGLRDTGVRLHFGPLVPYPVTIVSRRGKHFSHRVVFRLVNVPLPLRAITKKTTMGNTPPRSRRKTSTRSIARHSS